jgi:hypothetical protein
MEDDEVFVGITVDDELVSFKLNYNDLNQHTK